MAAVDEYCDPFLERDALAVLVRDGEAALTYFPRLRSEYFTDENLRRLFFLARRFVMRSGVSLSREALRVELHVLYPKDESTAAGILGMYDQLVILPVTVPVAYLVERLTEFARVRRMLESMRDVVGMLDKGRLTDALEQYEADALSLQASDPSAFVVRGEVFEDLPKRKALLADMKIHPERYRGILTGITELDRITGGLWKGELGFCFGKTGVGKSFFLLQVAFNAYLLNLRVLVVPVEMPLIQWQRRFDSRVSKVSYEGFKWATLTDAEEAQWDRLMLQSVDVHWKHGARVFMAHFPIGSPVSLIRAELERLIRQGTAADALVVDYADLFTPPRAHPTEQAELTEIFRELKDIAGSYDIPVWTATQARRDAYHTEQLSVEHVGYAAGKGHIADMVIGIARSDVDTLTQRLLLSIAKYRDGSHNRVIMCKPDFAIAMIDRACVSP